MIYQIENNLICVKVCSLGATLNSFVDKKTGIDVVLGFDTEEEYLKNPGMYLGATVARCANRIGKGTFTINGIEYHAPINNGPNCNHGGKGVSFEEFTLKDKTESSLTFERLLKDGEDGFPGNLRLTVIYEIKDSDLLITYNGISDKDTIMNVTNHSYFNMNGGKGGAKDEYLTVYSDEMALDDVDGMASENVIKVDNTAFDFRKETLIGDNIAKGHPNLSKGGIDHNYLYEKLGDKKLCKLKGDKLSLTVSSDLPDVQIYTANWFADVVSKNGIVLSQYKGVAMEAQYYPNAINYDKYLKPIIKANEEVTHFIKYSLKED